MPTIPYPYLERGPLLNIATGRPSRPYVWVQGWRVIYSADRISAPMRRAAAFQVLREAREAAK